MLANTITLSRLLFTFVVVAMLGARHLPLNLVLIATIVVIFGLDALDGYIARKRDETSQIGKILDTLADRIIENTFWVYFTVEGLIPLWIPIAIIARGFITDALQRMHGYPKSGWAYALTRSRVSRAFSGTTKMLAFTSLASVSVLNNSTMKIGSLILANVAVGVCLLRGIPFLFSGNRLLGCQDSLEKL